MFYIMLFHTKSMSNIYIINIIYIYIYIFLTLQDTHSEPGDGGAGAPGILAAFSYFFRDALG